MSQGISTLCLSGIVLALASSCAPHTDDRLERPGFALDATILDSQRAFDEVEALVKVGPRVSGTDGALRAARHLRDRLSDLGITAHIDTFSDTAPGGTTTFHNVIGIFPGNLPDILILGSHFDTKYGIDNFEGANDSGSSSGLLIELGRVWLASMAQSGNRPEMRLVFFDGEECRHRYGPHDGFHGSKHYVRQLQQRNESERVRAMILLDMVGDRDLSITIPRNSTPELALLAFKSAEAAGCRNLFSWHDNAVGDDHVPFLEAGIPAIDLIDFEFGSAPGKNDYWHTPEDTMDKLSVDSLDKVGRVTLHMLQTLVEEMQSNGETR